MIIVDVFANYEKDIVEIEIFTINKKSGAYQKKKHSVKRGTKADKQWAKFLQKYKSEYRNCASADYASWHKYKKNGVRTYVKPIAVMAA